MLIPQNLDDRNFKELVEDSIKWIPQYVKDWTDYNFHDPGITLIELFAWLTEMQDFYLNRIRDDHILKYLKLLGTKPKEVSPARVQVTFFFDQKLKKILHIPKGTKLSAGEITFETQEALRFLPMNIEKVVSSSGSGYFDHTGVNNREGLSFFAFGNDAKEGSRLYIGLSGPLDTLLSGTGVSLFFHLFEDYPVKPGRHDEEDWEISPSVKVKWEYYGWDHQGGNAGWHVLNSKNVRKFKDETYDFYFSGRVIFKLPGDMVKAKFYPFEDNERFWLRLTVSEGKYELSPRIESIVINTVPAVQEESFCEATVFSTEGGNRSEFKADSFLALTGENMVQAEVRPGVWKDCSSGDLDIHSWFGLMYSLSYEEDTGITVHLIYGNDDSAHKPDRIRLVSVKTHFKTMLGRSSGLPNQEFELPKSNVLPESLMLQVMEKVRIKGHDEFLWRDWVRVDDFDSSKPADPHFKLDMNQGKLLFGDGVNGAVPPLPDDERSNIRLISFKTTEGEKGNMPENAIHTINPSYETLKGLQVNNMRPASYGTGRELLDEAQSRARREARENTRAVTSEDFEKLTISTPGLRVARAKAVPLYDPEVGSAPACVTVIVVPYSTSNRPIPGKGFLSTVYRHLCKHRLITTRVVVVPPDYVKISIKATVTYKSGDKPDKEKIIEALNKFLSPLDVVSGYSGWPFGRAVYKSEIYEIIEKVDGVDFVEGVTLTAEGGDGRVDPGGNIVIGPRSLVYPGDHRIEIMIPGTVCRETRKNRRKDCR